MKLRHLFLFCVICCSVSIFAQNKSKLPKTSGNPIFEGWYADPEGIVFGDEYWIYPTYSAPYDDQIFMDAFSSKDLVNWTKHPRVLSKENISWLRRALWAPAVIHANDKYYFFFGANDIQNNNELGGIGVAVADNPAGPFKDALGKPLIDKIVNGAQPIDQFVFKDDDGQYYMYYGGWGHCNMVKMAPDLLSIVPFEDGTIYKEVTPENYVEGPFMLKRKGKYYFMWSEGGWGGPDYRVAYAIADSPFGPFKRIGTILQQDANVATAAGHHSVVKGAGEDEWYIIYHRRPLGETAANSRATCIDRMYFDKEGKIDFNDKTVTENTRVSYPIDHIDNIVRPVSSAPAAKNVIFLSADAFGVLPPVSILTPEQTKYYFLSGFTAKLAGTERGITEPTPTFSACFGQAFLELHPTKYAEELVKKMEMSGAKAYLVNTGWNGSGKRISIKDTRGIIDAILDGSITKAPTKTIPHFNFEVPTELPGVDSGILDPRDTYANVADWEEKAKDLASRFVKNFAKYEGNEAGKALVEAGPKA